MMTSTAWEIRNTLIAILNGAKRGGKPYVDIRPSDLDDAVWAEDRETRGCDGMHRDIMTKMMRPGDTVLEDSQDGDARMVIRYVFDANRSVS
jgi:hypothetical protein